MKNVIVLGCGPAGLFAAHAVILAGMKPVIISKRRKSEMFGAQYLHRPIPYVSQGGFEVEYRLEGTPEEYAVKVYGPNFKGRVSPEDLVGVHEAWDIRQAYSDLWIKFAPEIIPTVFNTPEELAGILEALVQELDPAHIVSSIPGPLLCQKPEEHGFLMEEVWSIGDAPERGIFSPVTSDMNTVTCSGDLNVGWYRKANILGYNTVEWPGNRRPPFEGIASVRKPIKTNCDCLPSVHRVGRYGKWTKGVLSHEAFYETYHGIAGKEYS